MTTDGVPASEWARVRELQAEIVNFAYHDQYEASGQASYDLVALAAELEAKYGPLPALLAIRADHVTSLDARESLLHETYRQAECRNDAAYQAWAAVSLASHYVDVVPDMRKAEHWASVAEVQSLRLGDPRLDEDIDRLRGVLTARQRRAMVQGPRGRRTRS
jgi:hypothetical protein